MSAKSSIWIRGVVTLAAGFVLLLAGCEQKEKILDIETPNGELEIERDRETGDVDVEIRREDGSQPE